MEKAIMTDRRLSRRVPFRRRVRYGLHDPQFSGYTSNISESGIAIESFRVLPPRSKVIVYIDVDKIDLKEGRMDHIIKVEGVVEWVYFLIPGIPSKMGVKFLTLNNDLVGIYKRRISQWMYPDLNLLKSKIG
jgi:hypothetical protein